MENIDQPPARLVEILTKTVKYNDDPVSIATISLLKCWFRLTDDRILRQIGTSVGEAGELDGHIRLVPASITHNPRQRCPSLASKHGPRPPFSTTSLGYQQLRISIDPTN